MFEGPVFALMRGAILGLVLYLAVAAVRGRFDWWEGRSTTQPYTGAEKRLLAEGASEAARPRPGNRFFVFLLAIAGLVAAFKAGNAYVDSAHARPSVVAAFIVNPSPTLVDAQRTIHALFTPKNPHVPIADGTRLSEEAIERLIEATYGERRTIEVSVVGRKAEVAVSYVQPLTISDTGPLSAGGSLSWQTHAEVPMTHGRGGWYVEGLTWTARHLVSIEVPGRGTIPITDSTENDDGTIVFHVDGFSERWSSKGERALQIVTIGTPVPSGAASEASDSHSIHSQEEAGVVPPRRSRYVEPIESFSHRSEAQRSSSTFHGYLCTANCLGHERGYEWAAERGITEPDDCPLNPHNSHSFTEGCWAEAGRHGPY